MRAVISPDARAYPYPGMGNANPDAVTQITTGYSTTTFTYDNNGNVTQKTVDGTTTTYVYDYANRLTALVVLGATKTYAYDSFGNTVLQTGTSTTYLYPFKWYSVASSTGTGAKYATTTDYVFNGDTLLATVDQQSASGVATGSPATRYIHPDHLGSTNVVTNESGAVVQTLDYYPYGSTRISSATSTMSAGSSSGNYARYMDPSRGQFTSEEPIFLALGDKDRVQQLAQRDQQAYLSDPQRLNTYSYAKDNPITSKDTSGLISESEIEAVYKLLYANSGRETVNSGVEAFFGGQDQSPQQQSSAQAQFRYDAGTFSVTTAAIYGLNLSGTGAVIDIGNVVLGGIDKYCAGHLCKNLNESQNVTAAQILANIPTGSKVDYTLSNNSLNGSAGGGPVWGQKQSTSQSSGNIKSRGGGSAGSSSSPLIGLYQSLVSVLSAYVRALSAPASSSHAR